LRPQTAASAALSPKSAASGAKRSACARTARSRTTWPATSMW
jgi:hypothetical protein